MNPHAPGTALQHKVFFIASACMVILLLAMPPSIHAGTTRKSAENGSSKHTFITVATGPLHGIYYPTGIVICNLVNSQEEGANLLCSVQRTSGSIYNIKALAAGQVEFCLCQSDQLSAAFSGTGEFSYPLYEVRTVARLFEESFTVVVRAESPIKKVRDLAHKTISTGMPGSGGYATLRRVFKTIGLDFREIKKKDNISNARALTELCSGGLDAVVFTAGHPYAPLREGAEKCRLRLLRVRPSRKARQRDGAWTYSNTVIPGGIYKGIDKPVKTIGVAAILATSVKVAPDTVFSVTRAIMENIDSLVSAQPVLRGISPQRLADTDLQIPLHRGAEEYYQEHAILEH